MKSFSVTISQISFVIIVLQVQGLAIVSCELYHIVQSESEVLLQESNKAYGHHDQKAQTLEDFEMDSKAFSDKNDIKVEFSPGEHVLHWPIYFNNTKTVTLFGSSSENKSIVRCYSSGFKFQNVQDILITHLTISGCIERQSLGAAVFIKQSYKVSFVSCLFIDNLSHYGFKNGILNYSTGGGALGLTDVWEVVINDCLFRNNSADPVDNSEKHSGGGAISFLKVNKVEIVHSEFTSNHAQYGGAVLGICGNLTVSYCNFADNRASEWHGGAINLRDFGKLVMNNCLFKQNYAEKYGGAVYVWNKGTELCIQESYFESNVAVNGSAFAARLSSSVVSVNNTYTDNASVTSGTIYLQNVRNASNKNDYFNNNTADYGGAVLSENSTTFVLTWCTFTGNRAVKWHGGAINFRAFGTLTIDSCSFNGNSAKQYGGAVYTWRYGTELNSRNSQYVNNTAEKGGAISANYLHVRTNTDLYNNSFTDNVVSQDGGAIYLLTAKSIVHYVGNNFVNNKALRGGAIFC